MSKLNQQGFTVNTPDIDKNGDLEEYEDIDDIDVEARSIRINCDNCDDYIVLEDF